MAQVNRISSQLTEQEEKDALESLKTLDSILKAKVVGLSKKERQTLLKMRDKTVALVNKISSYTDTNPEFVPPFMNQEEFKKDLGLVNSLKPILDIINVLQSDVDDTMMLAGSEAYTAALIYYHSVKYAAEKGNVAAKPIYEDLAQRFPGSGKRKKSEEQAPAK